MESKEIFAKRLVKLRENRGITQQTLADDLKITRQSLSLYEKAERTINIDLLVKIAKYFDVSTDYLLGLTDNATTDTDLKAVCEYTGLNENSINNIIYLKKMNVCNAMDYFISNYYFTKMMCYLDAMKRQLSFIGDEYGLEMTNQSFDHIFIDDFYTNMHNEYNADFYKEIISCHDKMYNLDLAIYNVFKLDAEKCFDKLMDGYKYECICEVSELTKN